MRRVAAILSVMAIASLAGKGEAFAAKGNDYPTVAIADYVFGCMATNGQTRQALEHCSCSIDVVASILPYDRYVEAETALSMGQMGGEKGAMFKSEPHLKAVVADLKRAQAEAEIRCFR